MITAIIILYFLGAALIFHTMFGYPLSLKLISLMVKKDKVRYDLSLKSTVTIIVPAHSEEKVIGSKLENLIRLSYPKELYEINVSSDNSTDDTNKIVEKFIANIAVSGVLV